MISENTAQLAFPNLSFEPPHPASGGFKHAYFVRSASDVPLVLKLYSKPVKPDEDDDDDDEYMTSDDDERARRELAALSSINSPHLIRLTDGPGHVEIDGHLHLWFIEPRLPSTLADHQSEAPWAAERTRNLMRDLLTGAAALHSSGLVHRDIKPANIGIEHSGKAVLFDFGIAFLMNATRVTEPNALAPNTTLFSAPEQFDPRAVPNPRIDQFQIGLCSYVMATGVHPFWNPVDRPENVFAYLQIIQQGPDVERLVACGQPEDVVEAITRMLGFRPYQRFRTDEHALRAIGGG